MRDYRIVDYCKHVAVVSGEQMRKILQQVHTFHSIPLRVSFISGKYTPFTLYRCASLSSSASTHLSLYTAPRLFHLRQVHTFHSIPICFSFISGKYTPFTLYCSSSLSSRFWCSCWWFLSFLNRIRLNSLNLILKYLNVSQSTHQQREIIC